jgi:glutamate dehydrogenase (NAD(P)+)
MAPTASTTAVPGFGEVGRDAARFLGRAGIRVWATSDHYGAVYASGGMDIGAVALHTEATGSVVGSVSADLMEPTSYS